MNFRDGSFPEQGDQIKVWFEALKDRVNPDVICHSPKRRCTSGPSSSRSACLEYVSKIHLVLEYEIPKWDGDIGSPNLYMPVSASAIQRKADLLMSHFGSQRSKQWFDAETFLGLARLRGMECRAHERYAEAFIGRKVSLA